MVSDVFNLHPYSLVRPVYIPTSRGQYAVNFRLDLAGVYTVRITSRAQEPIYKNDRLNLGAGLGAGIYMLQVLPGDPRATYSTSSLIIPEIRDRATIGVISNFTIFSRDRFGNKATAGGSDIQVQIIGPKYLICDLPVRYETDPLTGIERRLRPNKDSLHVPNYVDPETSG